MPAPLNLYLVRHGESEANLNYDLNKLKSDHTIVLSDNGQQQPVVATQALVAHLQQRYDEDALPRRLHLYVSPYVRTRQTADGIQKSLEEAGFSTTRTESVFLREIEYGLFDGIADEDLPKTFPIEYAHFEKLLRDQGRFYARMPMGESRCDVAQRVHQFFGTLQRDHQRHGADNVVIVTHGVTLRAFVMMWCGLTPEWIEAEPNPPNCAVRAIEGGVDQGYIFPGFKPTRDHIAQERREAGII